MNISQIKKGSLGVMQKAAETIKWNLNTNEKERKSKSFHTDTRGIEGLALCYDYSM